MIWCNAAKVQILVSVLFLADLPVLSMTEKILKNHAKYHRIAIFTADDNNAKINDKNLFALIASPRGRITPQMSNVTNQNLKV